MGPISKRIIQGNLIFLRNNGVTIFLTSHNLELVEDICNEIAIIDKGKIIFHGLTPHIRENIKNELTPNQNPGLEKLFLELVSSELKTKYLSWYEKQ